MLSRVAFDAYVASLDVISKEATDSLRRALQGVGGGQGVHFSLVHDMTEQLLDFYGDQAAYMAARLYDELAQVADGVYADAVMSERVAPKKVSGSLVRAGVPGMLEAGDLAAIVAGASSVLDLLVKGQARQTMTSNAIRDRVRFARVPTGTHTCEFCQLLASRGFVYATRESAGELGQYHWHCDCQIVPSFERSPRVEGYNPGHYQALYYEALNRAHSGDPKEIRRAWRQMGRRE
jgi:hypothetical protein